MRFSYSPHVQQTFPARITGVLAIDGIHDHANVSAAAAAFMRIADARLSDGPEGEFPEIQAWRRAFSTMGMKPTQYRCASEALLRRYRKDGSPPLLHPLVDISNAASMAFAMPVAVFDRTRIEGNLIVRQADGTERYATFGGGIEHPDLDEIIFADDAGNAHARRWANRQSKLSAVGAETTKAIIIAEGLHDKATADMERLISDLGEAIRNTFGATVSSDLLLSPGAIFQHPSVV
jgi:DNA/RNA-binding domain of Phe-tRNA-synthetase-like protein